MPAPLDAPVPPGMAAAAARVPAEANERASAAATAVFLPDHRGGVRAGAVAGPREPGGSTAAGAVRLM